MPKVRADQIARRGALFIFDALAAQVYLYIIMNRLEEDRHPFFSDMREYCEAHH